MGAIRSWKAWAGRLKLDTYALYLSCRHPEMPLLAKLLAVLVVAYAFSPIDLIPDFIPILGHLDDLILLPLGVALVLKLTPPAVLEECRGKAREAMDRGRPASRAAAVIIAAVWLLVILFVVRILVSTLRTSP